MRALYYPDWNRLELRDCDVPQPAQDEVLIRVAACGVCGSEIETFISRSHRRTPPLIMGHEFCGVVETVTDGIDTSGFVYPGARVVSNAVLHCGACEYCLSGHTNLCANRTVFGMHRQGAFAEFVVAPADSLFPWPANVDAEAACLSEPLANGVHVAGLIAHLDPRLVLIVGAGSIGLMCLQAVRHKFDDAICIVTDIDPERLAVAKRLGAHAIVRAKEDDLSDTLRSQGGRPAADVVIDAAGTGATKQRSIEFCRPGGTVVWIGLAEDAMTLHTYELTLAEKSIVGSYGATSNDIRRALQLMESNQVDVSSWVATFKPADWVEGFIRQLDPATRDVKAVLVN